MSIQYCDYCDRKIDTDFDAEHFDCADEFQCIEEEIDKEVEEIPQFKGTKEKLNNLINI